METLGKEIFDAVHDKCISDESAKAATEAVLKLMRDKTLEQHHISSGMCYEDCEGNDICSSMCIKPK